MQKMRQVVTKDVGGEKVEYSIVWGNEKIVFIKAGAGGSTRGFQDKYVKMAERINKLMGATVICASNPCVHHKGLDEEAIRWVISEKGSVDFEVYFVGTSDGAYKNLSLAKKFPQTVKFIPPSVSSSIFSPQTLLKFHCIRLPQQHSSDPRSHPIHPRKSIRLSGGSPHEIQCFYSLPPCSESFGKMGCNIHSCCDNVRRGRCDK